MKRRHCARGFTLIELLAVLMVAFVVLAVVMLPSMGRTHCGGRQMKDATQVRGLQQACAIWANQNAGLYPIPSAIDSKDATVAEKGTAKDVTANILSVLIFTGGISVELCVSPAESNTGGVTEDDDYMFVAPKTAVDPANALWDPAFASDFTGGKVSNNSYAHILASGPNGPGGARWKDTFTTTEPVVGNRGPEIASITRDAAGRVKPKFAIADSNTFLIHGSRSSWEGNIAYNDGHVSFETRLDPEGMTYRSTSGKRMPDCLFYDEPDDANGNNAFMTIWTKAGDTKADFKGIWD